MHPLPILSQTIWLFSPVSKKPCLSRQRSNLKVPFVTWLSLGAVLKTTLCLTLEAFVAQPVWCIFVHFFVHVNFAKVLPVYARCVKIENAAKASPHCHVFAPCFAVDDISYWVLIRVHTWVGWLTDTFPSGGHNLNNTILRWAKKIY